MSDVLLSCVLLVVGFVFLIKGADFFVDGSASVAAKLRIPSMIVGLTIVAFGTSLPEMAVSTVAAMRGENTIAVSNVIGSNFFNLYIVLGACALVRVVQVKEDTLKREYPFMIFITMLLGLFLIDNLSGVPELLKNGVKTDDITAGTLSRSDGMIFLIFFVLFMFYTVKSALKNRSEQEDVGEEKFSSIKCLLCIVVGLAGICIGGDMVVKYAKNIATVLGMSDTLVGLTIVALGTSLPELVTSLVASAKGENDMAVGNVIGSNIFNILIVLGISSTIFPIAISVTNVIDICLLLVCTVFAYPLMLRGKSLKRSEGAVMVLVYAAYLAYIILRV